MDTASDAELAPFLDWFFNDYLLTDEGWHECYQLWQGVLSDFVTVAATAPPDCESAEGPLTGTTFYKVHDRWLLPPCRSLVTLYYPRGTDFRPHSEYGKPARPLGKCMDYVVGGERMMSMSRDFLAAMVPGSGVDYLEVGQQAWCTVHRAWPWDIQGWGAGGACVWMDVRARAVAGVRRGPGQACCSSQIGDVDGTASRQLPAVWLPGACWGGDGRVLWPLSLSVAVAVAGVCFVKFSVVCGAGTACGTAHRRCPPGVGCGGGGGTHILR